MIGIHIGFLLAVVGEEFQRMSAILDGANDVTVHAIAVIARIAGRNEIAVVVGLSVQLAGECSAGQRRGRDGRNVAGVAIVANGAADAI